MLEASYVLIDTLEMKGSIDNVRGDLIPRLSDVRRAPARYHRVLPLPVIKCYQCVVLGASAHILTIGITERENEALLQFLQVLTGATIFPVLVEPRRMRLLVVRIERHQRFSRRYSRAYYTQQLPAQLRQILALREEIRERA